MVRIVTNRCDPHSFSLAKSLDTIIAIHHVQGNRSHDNGANTIHTQRHIKSESSPVVCLSLLTKLLVRNRGQGAVTTDPHLLCHHRTWLLTFVHLSNLSAQPRCRFMSLSFLTTCAPSNLQVLLMHQKGHVCPHETRLLVGKERLTDQNHGIQDTKGS